MEKKLFICLILLIFYQFSFAYKISVKDFPNDDGSAQIITWTSTPESSAFVKVSRIGENGNELYINSVPVTTKKIIDKEGLIPGQSYRYRVEFLSADSLLVEELWGEGIPVAQWFNTEKTALLILMLILSAAVLYYIFSAKRGKDLYIRKIGGLEAIDEAVGRATELGRPILFVPGTMDLDDMQTIAGLTILGKVAQKAAEYETDILVPVSKSMVLSTAKEIVKESYMKAGKPDSYKSDSVFYLTDDQFGFVAGVDGIIMRQKPAANFYLGTFYAESLILAETGFANGSIQTSGTAMPSQLPFFIAACDYTLIGEELFAASAYLSKEPNQLGSLKGQDFGKALFVVILILGVILEICGIHFLKDFLTVH